MSDTIRVQVEDKELLRNLRRIEAKVRTPILEDAVMAAAEPIAEEARKRAPRGPSGSPVKLHREIAHELGARRPGRVSARVHTGRAFWGLHQEYGTSRHGAQPTMRPSLEAKANDAVDAAATAMRRGINRVR